jgi:hypothetical protein
MRALLGPSFGEPPLVEAGNQPQGPSLWWSGHENLGPACPGLFSSENNGALTELGRRHNCGGSKKKELHAAVLGQCCTLTYRPQTVL